MCMQCSAKAELVKADVLPGYALYRSTKNTAKWPAGWLGIVVQNDPVFVFKGPLRLDPCEGLTEDDLDAMPEHPEGYDEFKAVADELTNVRFTNAVGGTEFIQACVEQGYDDKNRGTQLGYWLAQHLALQLHKE